MTTTTSRLGVYINNQPMLSGDLRIDPNTRTMWSEGPRPDPRWEHTDSNGHFHARSDEDKRDPYPTLETVTEPQPCDGSCGGACNGEGFHATHYFCRICREEITPGTIPGPYSFDVPGLMEWSVEATTMSEQWRWHAGDSVSVRLVSEGQALFGVALVSQMTLRDDIFTVELLGTGPLGRRKT